MQILAVFYWILQVEPSDSLTKIAIKYETSIEELKLVNGLHDNSELLIRHSIKIPTIFDSENGQNTSAILPDILQISDKKASPKIQSENAKDYFSMFDAKVRQVTKNTRETIAQIEKKEINEIIKWQNQTYNWRHH